VDFSETTVGFLGRLLWALIDTLMGLFVVQTFKSRVTLKDPSILPFLPSVMTVSPMTEFTDIGPFVDLRASERKLYPDRLSTFSANRGKSSANDGRWRIPWLGDGDGNVTSTTKKSLSFCFGGNNRNGVKITTPLPPLLRSTWHAFARSSSSFLR